jgi:hypothetical protein
MFSMNRTACVLNLLELIGCSFVVTACDPNCIQCNTAGPSKCDVNMCKIGYGYSATTQTCVGKY